MEGNVIHIEWMGDYSVDDNDTTGGFCWILVEKWLMVSKNNSK